MQQPQQIPIFVPYFNQPRVAQQQEVPQQIVYSDQQQQLQQPSIYPQAPLIAPEQPVVQQEPVQQQAQCPFARGACQRGRCCKRVDAKKALKLFAIIPLALYIVNYLALVFRWAPYRYTGSYSTLLTMAIISTIVAAVAIRKSSVALLGVFIGMTVFSILAGVGSFIGGITIAFYSFMGFLVAASEVLIGLSKIASVIAAAKLLKKIRAEMSLPQFVEQQAQQEEAAPQAPQVAVQQVSVPVVQEAAPQPQQHVAPMYPAFQTFQAPTIPMVPPSAPIVQQPVQFATELKLLNDMGFTDAQKNMELLQKHNGSLQAVVMSYVQA